MVTDLQKKTIPKIWVYNYDFDLGLAGRKTIVKTDRRFSPWHLLNRSSLQFLPFCGRNDKIVCYEPPVSDLKERLWEKIGFFPEICLLQPTIESNAVFKDLDSDSNRRTYLKDSKIGVWGWSPDAVAFIKKWGLPSPAISETSAIVTVNSKRFSHLVRSHFLPDDFSIPSAEISRPDISPDQLKTELLDFFDANGPFLIKHFFGTAGKLADRFSPETISGKKLKKWCSWIRSGKGILLEKVLKIGQEWSIQAEIDPAGKTVPIALTKLYSGTAGQYMANILSDQYSNRLKQISTVLQPAFDQIVAIGYFGPVGIDLIETENGDFKLVEINARLTMGRIAYEWFDKIGVSPTGLYTNIFFKPQVTIPPQSVVSLCDQLETGLQTKICPINFTSDSQTGHYLLTLFLEGHNEQQLSDTLSKLKLHLKHC